MDLLFQRLLQVMQSPTASKGEPLAIAEVGFIYKPYTLAAGCPTNSVKALTT